MRDFHSQASHVEFSAGCRPGRIAPMTRTRPARAITLVAALVLASFGCATNALSAEETPVKFRYSGEPDQVVAYRIEITADRYDATDTLKGVVSYKFNTATDYAIRVTYRGGLTKSSQTKPSSTLTMFRGPQYPSAMFGPPGFGPFSRPPFPGLTSTTNEVTMTPLGEIKSLEGDSQLPFLLGNASLLVFEPLPEQPKQMWSVSMELTITEESTGRRSTFPPPTPFDREPPRRTTAGSEIQTYHVRAVEGPLVIVDKTYRLNSPAVTDDVSGFEINGTGTWTFNRELGVSESLELTQKVVAQRGETTATFPMTIRYTRMPDEEYLAYQEDQKKKHEEAQRELTERREREANTPLTEMEIRVILEELESDDTSTLLSALRKLNAKNPKKNDPRVALALAGLRDHEHHFVQQYSKEAAQKWPLPEGLTASATKHRLWSDRTGNYTVEAKFLELEDNTVYLQRTNGETLKIHLDQLCQEDQTIAQRLAQILDSPPDNPFD